MEYDVVVVNTAEDITDYELAVYHLDDEEGQE